MSIAKFAIRTAPALALAACPVAACAQSDDPFDDDAIVVSGAIESGAVQTDIPPEIRIERVAIRALGANSLAEVVATFTHQARSLRGGEDEPIVLLDGRRIGDRREIDELPPEAILRIEIFPEEVALQYGYPPDRRVVNVILRPKYRAILLQSWLDLPFGDGRTAYSGKAGIVRQSPKGRLNLDLSFRRQDPVADEASGAGADLRWRLPRNVRGTADAVWSREFANLSLTASAGGKRQTEDWKLGRAAAGSALRRREIEERAGLGLTLASRRQGWSWTATGTLDWQGDRAVTRDSAGSLSPAAGYSMRGVRREAELDFTASGPIAAVSSSEIRATLAGGMARRRAEASDLVIGGPETMIRQDSAYASGSIDLPLLRDDAAVLFGEGKLTTARGEGIFTRYGLGLRGSPATGLSFSASWSDQRSLPEFADLADLPLLTPNALVYDFVSGRSVYAGRRDGGNPALRLPAIRTLALRVQYKPFESRNLAFTADFTDLAIRDGVSEMLGPTPQIEAAFPERFERGGAGLLTQFDSRPLNFAREDRSLLRWGLNWTQPLGPAQAAPGALEQPQLQLAAFHSWTLEDRAVLRAGSSGIDLLDGGAIGETGGTSRHRIELQLAYASPNGGVRLTGDWSSPTRADAVAPGGHSLYFRSGFNLGLRLFLNLKALHSRAIDLGSGRIYLAFDNILANRTRIRDETGRKVDYYRGDEDNSGPVVRLSFRRFFY